MSLPSLKLVYYPMGGRAAAARLTLNHCKIPFEDERLTGEQLEKAMAENPAHFPCETVPVLLVDGGKVVINQSAAITFYAARLGGIFPTDLMQASQLEEAFFQIEDLVNTLVATMGKEGDELKAAREEWVKTTGAKHLKRIEAIFNSASDKGPFFLGEQPGPADFAIAPLVGWFATGDLDHVPKDFVAQVSPKLAAVAGAVMGLPSVQEFMAKHPAL